MVQSDFCQIAVSASAAGAVLTVASSGAIFWFRVRALWGGSLIISAIAGVFYLIMLACWVSYLVCDYVLSQKLMVLLSDYGVDTVPREDWPTHSIFIQLHAPPGCNLGTYQLCFLRGL